MFQSGLILELGRQISDFTNHQSSHSFIQGQDGP